MVTDTIFSFFMMASCETNFFVILFWIWDFSNRGSHVNHHRRNKRPFRKTMSTRISMHCVRWRNSLRLVMAPKERK